LKQAKTVTDMRFQEALSNMAILANNPSVLPYYSVLSAGSTQVSDQGTLNPSIEWVHAGFSKAALSLTGQRTLQDNWTVDSIKEPEKLAAMRCAYHFAMGLPGCDSCDCQKTLHDF